MMGRSLWLLTYVCGGRGVEWGVCSVGMCEVGWRVGSSFSVFCLVDFWWGFDFFDFVVFYRSMLWIFWVLAWMRSVFVIRLWVFFCISVI